MNKELALRTFCYLIGYYRTHDETIINTQEIEAIEFMLKTNEELEQQCEKQKEIINKAIKYINSPDISIDIRKADGSLDYVSINELLNILKEV